MFFFLQLINIFITVTFFYNILYCNSVDNIITFLWECNRPSVSVMPTLPQIYSNTPSKNALKEYKHILPYIPVRRQSG